YRTLYVTLAEGVIEITNAQVANTFQIESRSQKMPQGEGLGCCAKGEPMVSAVMDEKARLMGCVSVPASSATFDEMPSNSLGALAGKVPTDQRDLGSDIVQWMIKNLNIEDPASSSSPPSGCTVRFLSTLGSTEGLACHGTQCWSCSCHGDNKRAFSTADCASCRLLLLPVQCDTGKHLYEPIRASLAHDPGLAPPSQNLQSRHDRAWQECTTELPLQGSEDTVEALHLGTLMAAHGYFFPISDHVLTLKDDGTFYRFQARQGRRPLAGFSKSRFFQLSETVQDKTPYFWPSNCWEPENTDYGGGFI
ncbi:hypothetical protein Z043_109900, partial [Scleropages formosus]